MATLAKNHLPGEKAKGGTQRVSPLLSVLSEIRSVSDHSRCVVAGKFIRAQLEFPSRVRRHIGCMSFLVAIRQIRCRFF